MLIFQIKKKTKNAFLVSVMHFIKKIISIQNFYYIQKPSKVIRIFIKFCFKPQRINVHYLASFSKKYLESNFLLRKSIQVEIYLIHNKYYLCASIRSSYKIFFRVPISIHLILFWRMILINDENGYFLSSDKNQREIPILKWK